MKAISVYPVWAGLIREGIKTLEIRSWRTRYRGELLICSSKRPAYGDVPAGCGLCVVEIVGCRLMRPDDEAAAGVAFVPGSWAWVLANVRPVEPFAVSGKLNFFHVEDRLIRETADKNVRPPKSRRMPAHLWG